MNAAAFACIGIALFAITGPLMQRATSVGQVVLGTPEILSVNIAPQIPTNSTGTMPVQTQSFFGLSNFEYLFPDPQPDFLPIIAHQYSQVPISGGVLGCFGRWEYEPFRE